MPAKSINEAKGLALFINDIDSSKQEFYLYDAMLTLKNVEENIEAGRHPFDHWKRNSDGLYALMAITNPVGQACDAKQVAKSAAKKGYGPLMYDIVMGYVGGLIPDRFDVSNKARNVWKQYRTTRDDVTKIKLDDIDNPKTPTKWDDAIAHRSRDLNYAFFIEEMPNVEQLFKNSDAFVARCIELGISEKMIKNNLQFAFTLFFSKMINAA